MNRIVRRAMTSDTRGAETRGNAHPTRRGERRTAGRRPRWIGTAVVAVGLLMGAAALSAQRPERSDPTLRPAPFGGGAAIGGGAGMFWSGGAVALPTAWARYTRLRPHGAGLDAGLGFPVEAIAQGVLFVVSDVGAALGTVVKPDHAVLPRAGLTLAAIAFDDDTAAFAGLYLGGTALIRVAEGLALRLDAEPRVYVSGETATVFASFGLGLTSYPRRAAAPEPAPRSTRESPP